jgi:RNA polymerase sigma factor (sigma-70 family)
MPKLWDLYKKATTLIDRLCFNKCQHLISEAVESCRDYIRERLERDDFQALKNYDPSKGTKDTTYLYMLISSRLIDFIYKRKREIPTNSSMRECIDENDALAKMLEEEKSTTIQDVFSQLKESEMKLIQLFHLYKLSHEVIGRKLNISAKESSKRTVKARKRLEFLLDKAGCNIKDIL